MLKMPIDMQIKCLPRSKFGVNCARNDSLKTDAGIIKFNSESLRLY